MSFEHFDRFFTFAAAGLGLCLAGGLNLALGRGGRRVWLRVVVTLVVCGLVVSGLYALTRPELALRATSVLVGTLLAVTALGSEWCGRRLTSLLTAFRKPAVRWGVVTIGGLGVVVASGFAFDRADDAEMTQEMQSLESALSKTPSQPTDRAHATTDRGNRIVLKEATEPRETGVLHGTEEKTLRDGRFHDQVIRRSGPTDHSNCHGWVFTGGKFLLSPDDVEQILKENGYQEIQEPRAGDLVVYRRASAVMHTAIVRYVTEGQPVLVEGKWGAMGVFLHPADKSFYGTEFTFHRSARNGHLLVGLGGSPGPAVETTAVAE
jgi:hypothetical protein